MKDLWLRNKRSKLSLESKILLEVLVLMVVVALCIAEPATLDNLDNDNNIDNNAIFSQEGFIDPFTLRTMRTIVSVTENSSGTVILGGPTTRHAIWIPFRPPVWSPFRPPWVPGKSPWPPGPHS